MAAFKACQQLRKLEELDAWLMPKYVEKVVVKMRGGDGGIVNPHHKAWRGSGNPIRVPVKNMDGWARFIDDAKAKGQDARYHATYLPLDKFAEGLQPLLLLTRGAALPETKLMKLLHPVSGRLKDVGPILLGELPALSKEDVEAATSLTKYIFQLINGKKGSDSALLLEGDTEPALLLIPVRAAPGVTQVRDVTNLVFEFATSLETLAIGDDLSAIDQLNGRVLVRQHGYQSYSLYKFERVRSDLTPNDPITTTTTVGNGAPTYLQQHFKMYARHCASDQEGVAADLALSLANTPLLEVSKMAKIRNLLKPTTSGSVQQRKANTTRKSPTTTCLIIPTFYRIFPFSASLVSSIHLLPSILTRYDQLLLAHSCNIRLFSGKINTDLVLEALTSPSAGSGFDYERLEFLGDTLLKLVATCHTFTTNLGRTEAELHLANKAILTNVRLLSEAKRLGLESYGVFRSSGYGGKRFSGPIVGRIGGVLTWRTKTEIDVSNSSNGSSDDGAVGSIKKKEEGEREIEGKGEEDVVKEKTLSDITEALIGAALLTSGTQGALSVLHTLHLIPPNVCTLSDFNHLLLELKTQSITEAWQDRISRSGLDHLQTLFDHTYRYPHLGLEAFTHPSLLASVLPSYQRLEFLGDAWLDYLIVRSIFSDHPDLSPGELTALKGLLASNSALSALGVRLKLHQYVASNSSVLRSAIATYASALEKIFAQQTKLKDTGKIDLVVDQYWTLVPRTMVKPKAIADVLEASLASIVVDSEFNEEVVARVFGRIFKPFYEEHCRFDSVRIVDAKRVIEYVFGVMRKNIVLGGCNAVQMVWVRSNLFDFGLDLERLVEGQREKQIEEDENLGLEGGKKIERKVKEEGEKDVEERLVQALLTELWVELHIGDVMVGKIVTLPGSAAHLTRAVGIARELSVLQKSITALTSSLRRTSTVDEDDDMYGQDDSFLQAEDPFPCSSSSSSSSTSSLQVKLVAMLDEEEYYLHELVRTLDWKRIHQNFVTSPLLDSPEQQRQEQKVLVRPFSLSELKAFIVRSEKQV